MIFPSGAGSGTKTESVSEHPKLFVTVTVTKPGGKSCRKLSGDGNISGKNKFPAFQLNVCFPDEPKGVAAANPFESPLQST